MRERARGTARGASTAWLRIGPTPRVRGLALSRESDLAFESLLGGAQESPRGFLDVKLVVIRGNDPVGKKRWRVAEKKVETNERRPSELTMASGLKHDDHAHMVELMLNCGTLNVTELNVTVPCP